jgi:hypothetical protein
MLTFVKAGIITDKYGNEFPTKELELATEEAMGIINMYPMIFPHLYKQGFKLRKYFEKGGVILQNGVVLTFGRYKSNGKLSRNATTYKKSGDFVLHQIATNDTVKGAAKEVLDGFVEHCKAQHAENLFLTVREHNDEAVRFYNRYGFEKDSEIFWTSKKDGIIKGIVYRLRLIADKNIETVCS